MINASCGAIHVRRYPALLDFHCSQVIAEDYAKAAAALLSAETKASVEVRTPLLFRGTIYPLVLSYWVTPVLPTGYLPTLSLHLKAKENADTLNPGFEFHVFIPPLLWEMESR